MNAMWPRLPLGRFGAAVAVVALVASAGAFVAPADAAGATAVRLDAGTDSLAVGERATVGVVVADADGGVGAYNVTVSVDADHAVITDAAIGGGADLTRVDIADDGSSATLVVALADTADAGSPTVATLAIEGTAPGETGVELTVNELVDEAGRTYEVTAAEGTELAVTGASTDPSASTPVAGATPTTERSTSVVELDAPADTVVALSGGWRAPMALLLAGAAFVVVFGAFTRRR